MASPNPTPLWPPLTAKLIGVARSAETMRHMIPRSIQRLGRVCHRRYRLRPAVKPRAKETIAYDPAIGSKVFEARRLETTPTLPPTQGPAITPARRVPPAPGSTGHI